MRLYNTLTRQEEEFAPLRDDTVRMYACGLTVYARGHIGNFRTFVALDVLRRALKHVAGFRVREVMNFTDVDDRTIAESRAAGVSLREYTDTYIGAFREDAATLGLEPAEENPRATDEENLRSMVEMIQALEANGHTYTNDGSVYFKIATLPDYGKLARLDHEGIKPGARIDADRYEKDDARDFVLWKATGPDEPTWDFGVGPGRPGWHIECSAMAMAELGETIDLHGGGDDLTFPHHECEAAQSEAATGVPLARHWMHVGMVAYEGTKMSKSLGNLVFVRNLRRMHDPRAIRLALMAHHYRAGFEWFDYDIDEAVTRLDRLVGAARRPKGPNPAPTLAAVRAALDDDLDTVTARDAIDLLAGGILAGSGEDPTAASGLASAAALLGLRLDATIPESWVRTT